ncbi:MAG: prepilin-type N-terminal cleavage/methylation domain-containing protein [Planctomycetota bacterium]
MQVRRINKAKIVQRTQYAGFTLIEVLITVALIALLSSIGLVAYIRSTTNARVQSTRNLIAVLNVGLQERMEAFINKTASPGAPKDFTDSRNNPGDTGNVITGSPIYRRQQVMNRLTQMRTAFPQQFWDIAPYPVDSSLAPDTARLNPPPPNASLSAYAGSGELLRAYQQLMVLTRNADGSPNKTVANTLVNGTPNTWRNCFFPNPQDLSGCVHDPATESSECLFLILSLPMEGSSFDINSIGEQYKADTDNDGLMEFVDAWGKPLRFYRWPVDFHAFRIDINGELPAKTNTNSFDPEGFLYDQTWFTGQNRRLFETRGYFRVHQAFTALQSLSVDQTRWLRMLMVR